MSSAAKLGTAFVTGPDIDSDDDDAKTLIRPKKIWEQEVCFTPQPYTTCPALRCLPCLALPFLCRSHQQTLLLLVLSVGNPHNVWSVHDDCFVRRIQRRTQQRCVCVVVVVVVVVDMP